MARQTVQGLWVQLRGSQGQHTAHGPGRGGAYVLHGRGYAPGGAFRKTPAAVLVFQAALRPGDEPAHRRHPGGDSHRYLGVRGLQRKSAGGEAGKLQRAADT